MKRLPFFKIPTLLLLIPVFALVFLLIQISSPAFADDPSPIFSYSTASIDERVQDQYKDVNFIGHYDEDIGAGITSASYGFASSGTSLMIPYAHGNGKAKSQSDPFTGQIKVYSHAYTAYTDNQPVTYWTQPIGTSGFWVTPDTWGSAYAHGYVRRMWQVTVDPAEYDPVNPITGSAVLNVHGELSGYESYVKAMLFLSPLSEVSWLSDESVQWPSVLSSDFVSKYPYQVLRYEYYLNGPSSDVDIDKTLSTTIYSPESSPGGGVIPVGVGGSGAGSSEPWVFYPGDVLVEEIEFHVGTVMPNDGVDRSATADFWGTLFSSLSLDTPGASLQPYNWTAPQQQPGTDVIPEPATVLLFGLAGLFILPFRRKQA